MSNPEIYNMKLHEEIITDKIVVLRVPGGWIYGAVFVPYSGEFNSEPVPNIVFGNRSNPDV